MEDFGAVLAGVASALAVLGALIAAWRSSRAWRQRRLIDGIVREAQTRSARLTRTVIDIDHRMSEGVGWAGWAIWPDSLGPLIETLDDMVLDAEAGAARVRGINAEPRIERLRADTEACWLLLRRGTEIYRSGTITNYRAVEGKPVPPGATGRDLTAALSPEDENHLRQTCRDFTHLTRSCLYQLGHDEDARSYEADWPATRAEIFAGDPEWQVPKFPQGTELAPPFGAW